MTQEIKNGKSIADCVNFKNVLFLISLRSSAIRIAKKVPNKRNRKLITSVLRVTVHAHEDRKKDAKFSNPTNGLKIPDA